MKTIIYGTFMLAFAHLSNANNSWDSSSKVGQIKSPSIIALDNLDELKGTVQHQQPLRMMNDKFRESSYQKGGNNIIYRVDDRVQRQRVDNDRIDGVRVENRDMRIYDNQGFGSGGFSRWEDNQRIGNQGFGSQNYGYQGFRLDDRFSIDNRVDQPFGFKPLNFGLDINRLHNQITQSIEDRFQEINQDLLRTNEILANSERNAREQFQKAFNLRLGGVRKYSEIRIDDNPRYRMIFDSDYGPQTIQVDMECQPTKNQYKMMGTRTLRGLEPADIGFPYQQQQQVGSSTSLLSQPLSRQIGQFSQFSLQHQQQLNKGPKQQQLNCPYVKNTNIQTGAQGKQTRITSDTLQANPHLADSIQLARSEFYKKYGCQLGDVISFSEQVVSGVNHKLIFDSQQGNVEIVVYNQPWTKYREVKSINFCNSK